MTELTARRIDGRAAPPIKVLQPLALDGGEDAETLAVAERRIPALLRHRDRAVTEEDYRRLSFEAPSVDVGRVEVLPRFKPRDRRFDVPGVVSVMALPAAPLGPAPNPRPDRPFIERLHAHLSARTPLATELYVIGCEYVALGLAVAVTLRDGFARDKVLLDVREALRRLLWPLAPGGLDRKGWPLGRAVRSRELEVEVSRVDGVDELRGINLFQQQRRQLAAAARDRRRRCANPVAAALAAARAAVGHRRRWAGRADRPARAAQPVRRCQCGRGAGRSGAVLMDANGLRFWMLAISGISPPCAMPPGTRSAGCCASRPSAR